MKGTNDYVLSLPQVSCRSQLSITRKERLGTRTRIRGSDSSTHDNSCQVLVVFSHKVVQFPQDVVSRLMSEVASGKYPRVGPYNVTARTLAVVLDQVLKARAAASMASLVSATPISGTVPRKSSLAGSGAL